MAKSEGSNMEIHSNDVPWLLRVITDLRQPRSLKENCLRRLRQIERETGKEYYGSYNCRNPSEIQRKDEENS